MCSDIFCLHNTESNDNFTHLGKFWSFESLISWRNLIRSPKFWTIWIKLIFCIRNHTRFSSFEVLRRKRQDIIVPYHIPMSSLPGWYLWSHSGSTVSCTSFRSVLQIIQVHLLWRGKLQMFLVEYREEVVYNKRVRKGGKHSEKEYKSPFPKLGLQRSSKSLELWVVQKDLRPQSFSDLGLLNSTILHQYSYICLREVAIPTLPWYRPQ